MERKIFYKVFRELTNTETAIVKFINQRTSEFISLDIKSCAQKIFASASSISKFARKMGFASFKAMQLWVSQENAQIQKMEIVKNSSSVQNICSNIKNSNIIALQRTAKDLDFSKLKKVKQVILGKKIYTFGIGSSFFAARELAFALNKIGFTSFCYESIHDFFLNINQKNASESVIILFSNSVKGGEIKTIREIALRHKIELVLVTANCQTKEAENETVLTYRTIKQDKRIIAMSSKISQLFLVDVFINWVGKPQKNQVYDSFRKFWG